MSVKILTICITGVAGFIGFHLASKLIIEGHKVVGIDNINSYYDTSLKLDRLRKIMEIDEGKNFKFYCEDISNKSQIEKVFSIHEVDYVINLAAQAGVRYSLENPDAYIHSNINGFTNLIELCRSFVSNILYLQVVLYMEEINYCLLVSYRQ